MIIKLKTHKDFILFDILNLGVYIYGNQIDVDKDYTTYDFCLLYFDKEGNTKYIIKPTNEIL